MQAPCGQTRPLLYHSFRLARQLDHNFNAGQVPADAGDLGHPLLTFPAIRADLCCLRAVGQGGGEAMAFEARRLEAVDRVFGIEAAGRLLVDTLPPWVQDLGLLVEAV